ncbi:DUF5977 domain-containing protein [uncultured Chryseobacterium sp.]|uniref:DUF5977 domain-containing protein n=1 Tax=uncultured Chryseobacterium sp. TaxID=259322 RepID=UPI0025D11E0B|nr:DUF5977 domain-containing protein [uncultured Chryseobacterium sp.]
MKKLFFLYFLFSIKYLFGQAEPKGVKSPDAAALEKFGKFGVSLSTGTVDINIPLHEIQLQNNPLNLSLNFDTSGLKLGEPAGISGINWTLQQPGIITRTINGHNDEYKSQDHSGSRGYFFFYDALNYPNLETQQGLDNFDNYLNNVNSHPNYIPEDLQPDVFNFTVLGKNGKFFLGNDGIWKVQSDHNFKIIINESDFILPFNYYPQNSGHQVTGKVIGKITMVDDDGNRFIFGSDHNSIEFSVGGFFNQKMDRINSTAWYLNEMKDRLGNTLFICSYMRDKPIARFYNNINNPNKDFLYRALSGSIISPVYLESIISKNEEIIFNYGSRNDLSFANEPNIEWKFQKIKTNNDTTGLDPYWSDKLFFLYTNFNQNSSSQLNPVVFNNWAEASKLLGWKKLDKITIRSNNIINKEINFDYINKPDERLFLTQVRFSNNYYVQGNEYDYKIKYNNGMGYEYSFDGSIPNYLWTGKNIFDNYSSEIEGNNDLCYLDCGGIINDALVKKGSLFKIVYPTGGFTYFDFEQNIFSRHLRQVIGSLNIQPSSKRNAGGLRIRKIVNFPDLNSTKRETISYNYLLDDYNSSGILVMDPQFLTPTYDLPWYAAYNSVKNGVKLSYNGSPVLYSKVTEERKNDFGLQKTEYFFTNYDTSDFYLDKPWIFKRSNDAYSVENFLNKYTDMSFLRGKLLEKKIFDSNNNLIIHNNYEYSSVSNFMEKFAYSFSWGEFPVALRKIFYGDFYLSKEIKREYFDGKEIKTETFYNKTDYPYQNSGSPIYNGSQRLNFTSILFPDGVTSKTETEYQFNCTSGNCFDEVFALPKKINNSRNNLLLSQDEITYKPLNTNVNSWVVDEAKKTYFNNATQSSKLKFTQYDAYGNVIEYQKENGNYVSVIMDSKGVKPIAKIEGVQYNLLSSYLSDIQKPYISNSTDAQNNIADPVNYANNKDIELRSYITSMRNSINNGMITSYTYDSYNRLKTITSPNGMVEFYSYDNLGRLSNIRNSDGKILKENKYNYTLNNSGTYPYLLEEITNDETKFAYLRNNCSNGQIGDVYYYTIPQNKYKSLISAIDLNSQVFNDANQNGQNEANLYGNCLNSSGNSLTGLSTIQLHTSGLYLNGNTVSGYFAFTPVSINSQTGSYIAKLSDNLIPTAERYYSYQETGNNVNRYWSFVIRTDGYIYAIANGTPLTTSSSIGINSFQYQK